MIYQGRHVHLKKDEHAAPYFLPKICKYRRLIT